MLIGFETKSYTESRFQRVLSSSRRYILVCCACALLQGCGLASLFGRREKEPGIHCMRMRVIARIFMTSLTSATLVVAMWNGFFFVLLVTTKRQKS